MSADINSVALMGRLTRDAELSYTQSGYAVCKISIAVNRKRKQGDQWVDDVSFFDINIWGKRGEAVAQYLTKGKQIGITGELRQDRWEKDGNKRSRVYVDANNIQLTGASDGVNRGTETRQSAERKPGDASAKYPNKAGFDDDVPWS